MSPVEIEKNPEKDTEEKERTQVSLTEHTRFVSRAKELKGLVSELG